MGNQRMNEETSKSVYNLKLCKLLKKKEQETTIDNNEENLIQVRFVTFLEVTFKPWKKGHFGCELKGEKERAMVMQN